MEITMSDIYDLRETLRLWDEFVKDAPLARQIQCECLSLITLWRSELQTREAIAKQHAIAEQRAMSAADSSR